MAYSQVRRQGPPSGRPLHHSQIGPSPLRGGPISCLVMGAGSRPAPATPCRPLSPRFAREGASPAGVTGPRCGGPVSSGDVKGHASTLSPDRHSRASGHHDARHRWSLARLRCCGVRDAASCRVQRGSPCGQRASFMKRTPCAERASGVEGTERASGAAEHISNGCLRQVR